MAKRGPQSELTDRNWDQEEEQEEAGEFVKASSDKLKDRQIIKAKRRQPGGNEAARSAFSGFGGFSFKPTQTSTPLFGGNNFFKTESKIPAEEKKESLTEKETDKRKADKSDEENDQSPTKRQKAETSKNGSDQNGSNSANQNTYLSNLKALNISVSNWIKQHLDKNPYCILTPIFKDYDNHLNEMEKDRQKTSENGGAVLKKEESAKPMEEETKPVPKTGLTFGMGNLNAAKETQPASVFSGFGFKPSNIGGPLGGGAPGGFSFAVGSSQPSSSSGGGAEGKEDDEYVPPQVETVEHKEEGALYSKKCKLFYQKDGEWVERGVGYLHLKKPDDKAQLLVRADTTLGNILLNIRLSESMPLSRQGKNNVSMMCIVNPSIPKVADDKPIPMLIRVKSGEAADELLDKMKEIRT